MKFIMTQTELERAVQQYVRKLIPGLDSNTVIEPEFKATRGADGFTAEVDIRSPEDLAEVTAIKVAAPEAHPVPAKAVSAPKATPVLQQAQPAPAPVAEVAEEPLSQDEEGEHCATEEAVQQAEPVQEEPAPAPAKRPLFGIRQPS